MTSRLEKRFQQARQHAESPIAYAGISPFGLTELSQLSMDVARRSIEALVRGRARQQHPDVTEGNEDGIRALSPYFTLFRDTRAFDAAISKHIAETEGLASEYGNALRTIASADYHTQQVTSRFTQSFELESDRGESPRGVQLRCDECTLFVLSDRALKDLLHNPRPEEMRTALSADQDQLSLDEIPKSDQKRLFAEAREHFAEDIEADQVSYADRQMKSLHSELTKSYIAALQRTRAPTASDERVRLRYEKLHDQYCKKAPLGESVTEQLRTYVINAYREERRCSTVNPARQYTDDQEDLRVAESALDVRLLVSRMTRVSVNAGRTCGPGSLNRHVVGVVEFTNDIEHNKFTESRFFAEATTSQGSDPKRLLPYMPGMLFTLPAECRVENVPASHPSSAMYLITAEHRASGEMRLHIEGQVYGVLTNDAE